MMKKYLFIIGILVIVMAFSLLLFKATKPHPKIALVIDDWGYNNRYTDLVFEIERPLAISILPNLRYSNYIAEKFREADLYDLILHLPLESETSRTIERSTIRCNMEKEKVLSILDRDINQMNGLIGVSNHQGSRATGDERIMRIIFSELKRRDLFFLDSLTTPDSVCKDVARSLRLKYARRDVFLDITDQTDLENFRAYIKKQLKELVEVAKDKGYAIGIGHNKRETLEVIRDSISEIEGEGVKIVHLKDLVR